MGAGARFPGRIAPGRNQEKEGHLGRTRGALARGRGNFRWCCSELWGSWCHSQVTEGTWVFKGFGGEACGVGIVIPCLGMSWEKEGRGENASGLARFPKARKQSREKPAPRSLHSPLALREGMVCRASGLELPLHSLTWSMEERHNATCSGKGSVGGYLEATAMESVGNAESARDPAWDFWQAKPKAAPTDSGTFNGWLHITIGSLECWKKLARRSVRRRRRSPPIKSMIADKGG